MAQWEYLVVQVGYPTKEGGGFVKWINGLVDNRFGKNQTRIFDAMAVLGREGWEFVAVDNVVFTGVSDPFYIFKRQVG